MLELLKNRRVWAGLVAGLSFTLTILKINFDFDVMVLTDLLTSFGGSVSDVIVGGLALWSFFKPKK